MNMITLKIHAAFLISNSENDGWNVSVTKPVTGTRFIKKITFRWIQKFGEHFQIVTRVLTGNH